MSKNVSPYRAKKYKKSSFLINQGLVGVPIERKIERMINNGEPIDSNPHADGMLYTERKDGVLPGYDIRTDKWDIALDATDKVSKSKTAKRDAKVAKVVDLKKKDDESGKPGKADESGA